MRLYGSWKLLSERTIFNIFKKKKNKKQQNCLHFSQINWVLISYWSVFELLISVSRVQRSFVKLNREGKKKQAEELESVSL